MISSCRIVRFTPENIGGTDTRGPSERWGIRPIHGHTPFVPQRWLFVPPRIGPTARNRTVTEHDKRRDSRQSAVDSRQSQSSVGVVSPSRQSESSVRVCRSRQVRGVGPSRQSESPDPSRRSVRVGYKGLRQPLDSPRVRGGFTDPGSRIATLWFLDSRPLKMADWDRRLGLTTRTDDSDCRLRLPTVTEHWDCRLPTVDHRL
jgi:hypothetical protein